MNSVTRVVYVCTSLESHTLQVYTGDLRTCYWGKLRFFFLYFIWVNLKLRLMLLDIMVCLAEYVSFASFIFDVGGGCFCVFLFFFPM